MGAEEGRGVIAFIEDEGIVTAMAHRRRSVAEDEVKDVVVPVSRIDVPRREEMFERPKGISQEKKQNVLADV